jgi:hypothetical protein
MSASAVIILQKSARIAQLLEENAGVKGATLEARLGHARRRLPREARAAGWRIAMAERKARMGEVLEVDEHLFDNDYRVCLRHLQERPAEAQGLPPIRALFQSGVTAVLTGLVLGLGLIYAGVI